MAVHDVAVDDARARGEDLGDLLAQAAEIRRQDRGRDARRLQQRHRAGHVALRAGGAHIAHIARSMLSPQLLQVTIAVLDMRTIVECSPQLGHTDTSSKR